MLSKLKVVQLAMFALVLSGCAAPHVDPTGGRTAQIRVLAPTVGFTESLGVAMYAGGKCSAKTEFGGLGGNLGGLREKSLPMLGMPAVSPIRPGTAFERRVTAGEPALFGLYFKNGLKTCAAYASFVPQADTDYEIVLHSTARHCVPEVRTLAVNASGTTVAVKTENVTFPRKCE